MDGAAGIPAAAERPPPSEHGAFLTEAYARLRAAVEGHGEHTLPAPAALQAFSATLERSDLPAGGIGPSAALDHIHGEMLPSLNGQNMTGRYFGFVTGSTLPVAEAADNVVSAFDQNVQVHLPTQTAATAVEAAALAMTASLLQLDPEVWRGRTFTTGATSSNVLGLACGREAVVSRRLSRKSSGSPNGRIEGVGELGLLRACEKAGVREIQVLTSMGHSSLFKAASIAGLGRASVKDLPLSPEEPWRLDLDAVERELARDGAASIIVISAGEVNTGRFATTGRADMERLRSMADRHDAWIHVDGAFGIFARALPDTDEFSKLHEFAAGLELADSITADGHKLLNVPYDAGIFFTRSPDTQSEVFQNPSAAYLAPAAGSLIPSPLNIGIENSRRFRALPIYAVLLSEGRDGLAEMFARMVRLARRVAEFIRTSPAYELLPGPSYDETTTHIIVLFRARDEQLNDTLVQRINETRKMYVSPTVWGGRKATRVAVSSWKVDVERDSSVVAEVLSSIAASS